ncbi:MAG: hypothetical protein JWM36_4167 [Hyphomicrobiales bacterium]|nr:hypothetical protein [Hyphomicrobiales bacterium]
MHSGDEENVRRLAYELWEKEGRPQGRHDHHWHEARQANSPPVTQAGSAQTPAPEEGPAPAERAKPVKAKSGKLAKKKS